MMEHRSMRRGDMVGSWVEMMIRVPRWRCWRMMFRNVSVRAFAASVLVMY